jgi:hypothetical protein
MIIIQWAISNYGLNYGANSIVIPTNYDIMKSSILFSAITAAALFGTTANAQIISLGVQFGGGRGPVASVGVAAPVRTVVYDDFYYLPEVDAYYSVDEDVYYYNDGYHWVPVTYIPGYRNYDWRTATRYQIRGTRPYMNHTYYASRYGNRDRYANNNRGGFNNRPDYRGNDRFDNRRDDRFDNRGNNGLNRGNDSRFDNNLGPQRGNDNDRGRNNQSSPSNRPQGGFGQPQGQPQAQPQTQPQRGGGFGQPQVSPQQGGGREQGNVNAQPSGQQGGRERGSRGAYFTDNQSSNGVTRIARN